MKKQNTILLEFLTLSTPVMVRGGIQWLISTFELVLLGYISSMAVAAAGIATTLLTLILSVLRIPSVGAIAIMSQAFAKGDSDTAHKQFKASVVLSVAGGVIFAIWVWFSGRWLSSFFI